MEGVQICGLTESRDELAGIRVSVDDNACSVASLKWTILDCFSFQLPACNQNQVGLQVGVPSKFLNILEN